MAPTPTVLQVASQLHPTDAARHAAETMELKKIDSQDLDEIASAFGFERLP